MSAGLGRGGSFEEARSRRVLLFIESMNSLEAAVELVDAVEKPAKRMKFNRL